MTTEKARDAGHRRVRVVPDGPILIDGPVEIETPDGRVTRSDRFAVALCACHRSGRYPLCDTTHRTPIRLPGRRRSST